MKSAFFKEVNSNQKSLIFCLNGTEYAFVGPNTKGVVEKSAIKIVAGLNHMYSWAYDTGRDKFINKLNLFFVEMYNTLKHPSFRNQVLNDVKERKFKSTQEATAYHYIKFVNNIDQDILLGVIEYIDDNIVENTTNEETLDNEDIFILTCIMTISKIMLIGVSLLERYKLENYLYIPIIKSVDRMADLLAWYYYNVKGDRGKKYIKVSSGDFNNNIYRFFYNELTNEFIGNNTSLFRNNGYSIDRIANEQYMTGICTISKSIPIAEDQRASVVFEMGDDWRKYKFINKNTVKYLKGIIHNMIGDKLGVPFKGVISIMKYENTENDFRYESAMKQEVMLEKRSTSNMNKRRKNIKTLKNLLNKIIKEKDLLNDDSLKYSKYITYTELTDFFVIKFLSEIAEDSLSMKLLDKNTYHSLMLVIANRLHEAGWEKLSKALLSHQISPSEPAGYLDDVMNDIVRLRKYHTHPSKCLTSIKSIVSYDFKRYESIEEKTVLKLYHIRDEFIQFLINDQIDKFVFLQNEYIYDYEVEDESKNN